MNYELREAKKKSQAVPMIPGNFTLQYQILWVH